MNGYSKEQFRAGVELCWFVDDFGNATFTPDYGLLMGFVCGSWDQPTP